jgi:ABC-type sugar transport system permease subunit
MGGIIVAFKDYRPFVGIWKSEWAGLQHFKQFFLSIYFLRLMRNTFLINFYGLLFGFPAPIILALLLNELSSNPYKRFVQTITYLPHFISQLYLSDYRKQSEQKSNGGFPVVAKQKVWNYGKRGPWDYVFDILNALFLLFLVVITLYPFLHVLFSSVSDPVRAMAHSGPLLWPLRFQLRGYGLVLGNASVRI